MLRHALVIGLLALTACSGAKKPDVAIDAAPVKVIDIVKGDEILVEHAGKPQKVRMLGIFAFAPDAPGEQMPVLSKAASDFLRANVVGKEVILELGAAQQDPHGRYLAYVRHAGSDLNRRMLEEGHAIAYTEFSVAREAEYLTSEKAARDARRGLWQYDAVRPIVTGLRRQWLGARAGTPDEPKDEMLATP